MRKFIDLSHTLSNNTPVFPGDSSPKFKVNEKLKEQNIQVTTMQINTHLGTHLDCPSHLGDKEIYTDNIGLNLFYGSGIVIDVRDKIYNNKIFFDLEKNHLKYDYLMFFTGHDVYWGKDKYFNTYPYLTKKLVEKLSQSSIKGIGIDTANVDKVDDLSFYNHHQLLANEKVIIENLTNLESLINQAFILMAFPLKIKNGDGSPIRAVALLD